MRTRNFLYNTISTAALQIITMIVGFFIPWAMLKYYGSEINGLSSSISQFIGYISLVEAGLAGAAVYALYKPIVDNNYKKINSILVSTRKFYNQTGIFFSIFVILLAVIYPLFVKTIEISNFEIVLLVIAIGATGAIDFFTMSKYRVLLTAQQKIYVLSMISILYVILNALIIFIMAYFQVNIVILRSVSLIAVLLRTYLLNLYIKRKYKFIDFKEEPDDKSLDKRWDALFLQILGSVQSGAPIVIITIFMTLKWVSVYSIYNMVYAGVAGILSIFISGLSSSFGDIIVRKDIKLLQKTYSEFEYVYYIILAWAYSCMMILIMPFIEIYTKGVNDINYYHTTIGVLFVLNGILFNLKTPQGMLVISAGLYKETRMQSLIQSILLVVSSIVLVYFYGVEGIIIGSIISNLYRTIDLMFFIPKNVTKLKIRETFYRMIRVFFIVVIGCYPFFSFYKMKFLSIKSFFGSATLIAVYCMIVVLLVNFIFERKTFFAFAERIRPLLKKIKKV